LQRVAVHVTARTPSRSFLFAQIVGYFAARGSSSAKEAYISEKKSCGNKGFFSGDIGPFCERYNARLRRCRSLFGDLGLFCGDIALFRRDTDHFCEDVGLICEIKVSFAEIQVSFAEIWVSFAKIYFSFAKI